MQENNVDQPPSLSQLLRESYLAEARAQQRHSEMSRSDASSSRLQIYKSLKGKGEDTVGHNDAQFPDLSAFLSQEELDKSVNLARQAIGHETRDEKAEVKSPGTPSTTSNISTVSLSTLPSVPFSNPSPVSFVAPPIVTQSVPEVKKPAAHAFTSDRKIHKTSSRQENLVRNSKDFSEGLDDFSRPGKNAPYGLETQSKKEFLNKAADFIEELSSLFKANSSKRIRPRTCKAHRSRNPNKSQSDEAAYPLSSETRERAVIPVEDRLSPTVCHHPVVQQEPEKELSEFQDFKNTEGEQFDFVSQETENQTESLTLSETLCPAEPVSEPPHFIQKLKSREVAEGCKVQLDCIVRGCPAPEVRWFCEGKELENSPDIQIVTDGELHSLIITEAFEEDTGRYSCFASNFCGSDSTSAEIYVEGASSSDSEGEHHFEHVIHLQKKRSIPAPSLPKLSRAPAAKDASETTQPEETTQEPAEESLPPTVPEPRPPVQTFATFLPVPEISTVSITNPAQEETPVYSSTLQPKEPEVSPSKSETQTEQTATCLPDLTASSQTLQLQSQTSNHIYSQAETIMAAPVFTKSLQELSVSEGQLVVLECRVKGIPSPRVDWYREGKIIQDSPDFRLLQKKPRSPVESEEICTLVIAEVFSEDSGMFTCTANNKYGTVSSSAALKVRGNAGSGHVRPITGSHVESSQIQGHPSSVSPQPELPVTSSIKPHSSTIRLDPLISSTLRLEPMNTSTLRLEPHTSSMLRPDTLRSSLPNLEPSSLTGTNSTFSLDPLSFHQDPHGSTSGHSEAQSVPRQILSIPKPFIASSAGATTEREVAKPLKTSPEIPPKVKTSPNHQNGTPTVVPLPDPPPNSCLKTGTQTNHKDSRTGSRVGLRVHFKLPEEEEDEQVEASCYSDEDVNLSSVLKEPPPVRAKPKLDPAQLQLLHNQVLMEQQQETEPAPPSHPQPKAPFQIQNQPEVQIPQESSLWSPRMHREPQTLFQAHPTATSAPAPPATFSPFPRNSVAPPLGSPQIKTSSPVTSPPPPPRLNATSALSVAPVSHANTIHASHLNLSPLSRAAPNPQFSSPAVPKFSTAPADPTASFQQMISPTPLLRSTHASLMNLTSISHTFNYARPKEFIAAQTFSPARSPSPTESPVPLLQELAAELNSSTASSPTLPPFSPPPSFSPTRMLRSPTGPPSLVSSPTPGSASFLNSLFGLRAQSPPQASSPTSSGSSPSPIQNPVAFLSSVLPSLTPSHPTNSMGLPRGAPSGAQKKVQKTRIPSAENIRESKELLLQDIEKKLQLRDDAPKFLHQQKLSNKGKTASTLLGPNIPATVINYDEEYKVSNFEQRLMSEIEFRLERTPVEESDDEVQHDDVPSGKCIAPIFDKKLKNFKAIEGVPVTFSCKVVGIPPPKVYWFKDGKQILRKNIHYKKIREGDGTCALHIESTTSDDDGNYTIMVANPQGRISCSGHLIVQTGPPRSRMTPIHSQRVRARIQEVESDQTQERFFRPHFLQAPGDMMAHEGKLCRLDCKVSGLPSPELMWLVNGKPIYPDLCHKMLVRENGVHSLVIDPLIQNDAGTYTCIASNKAGQSSFSLELSVVEKEMKHPPNFVEKLQNMGIPEGSPVRLECRVLGMPPPVIFWKKDNETISKTKDRISMSQDSTGYVCLLIQPTRKDDAGWYTVSAKNDAGVVSCTCRLDIYAQWHQSVPAPMRKAPRAGSRYAALTGQGLDIKSAFLTPDTSPFLFASSPPEATLESEEL